MSRTFASRTFISRTFASRTWSASGDAVVADPSQAGWISRVADRISVSSSQQRVSVCSPNHRVWIARQGNE